MKICPIGAELFHADGQKDMTKLTVVFPSFFNTPKRITERILRYHSIIHGRTWWHNPQDDNLSTLP